MRKHAIKGLEIFHGALLLSCMFCLLGQELTHEGGLLAVKSILLLPAVAVFSLLVRRVAHLWQYLLAVVLVLAGAVSFVGKGNIRIWMGVCIFIAAFSFFIGRAGKQKCWLEVPAYPWLLFYLGMYLLGNKFNSGFLVQYASAGAGIYFLICNFHTNLMEVEEFVRTHSSLERLPVKRMGRINQIMMWLVSGITAAAMFAAPYLGIDRLIRQAGQILKAVVVWFFGLFPSGVQEEIVQGTEKQAAMQMVPQAAKALAWWVVLLYKILDILGWLLALAMILGLLYLILRKIYGWYRQFYQTTEENGDRIERLLAAPLAERKKGLEKKKKENLFWDRSPNARIRKHYKRTILQKTSKSPLPGWTPAQIEEGLGLSEEDREAFHQYYEKARYGPESCTREEVQKMQKIR